MDIRTRLNGMMFLLYFAIGAWAVTLASYLMAAAEQGGLAYDAADVSWIYTTFALGGLAAPFLVGPLADRYFRADRLLFVASLASVGLLVVAAWYCDRFQPIVRAAAAEAARQQDGDPGSLVRLVAARSVMPLFGIMLIYCFFMQLSTTLSNAITLRNHPAGSDGYARTRMWGTIGWIAAGNLIALALDPISTEPLWLAAAASGLLALLSLTLPRTAPLNKDRHFLPALKLFQHPSFCVFMVASFFATLFNQFYGVYAHKTFTDLGLTKVERLMTLGQVLEVGCMFAIPWLRPKKYLKPILLVACAGWVLRAAVIVYADPNLMVLVAMPMHGWSFAFYFTTAQTYLKKLAGDDLAAGAQGVFAFMTSGLGALTGNILASLTIDRASQGLLVDWREVWVVPLVGTVALFLFVAWAFYPPRLDTTAKPSSSVSPSPVGPLDPESA